MITLKGAGLQLAWKYGLMAEILYPQIYKLTDHVTEDPVGSADFSSMDPVLVLFRSLDLDPVSKFKVEKVGIFQKFSVYLSFFFSKMK